MPDIEAASVTTPTPATPAAAEKPAEAAPAPVGKRKADPAAVNELLARADKGAPPGKDPKASASAGRPGAPAAATDGTTANPAEAGSRPETEGDPDLAMRLARLAKSEDKARETIKTAKALEPEIAGAKSLASLKGLIDPLIGKSEVPREQAAQVLAGLEKVGLSAEQREVLYWLLNDEVITKDPAKPKSAKEEAAEAAREEFERLKREEAEGTAKAEEKQLSELRAGFVAGINKLYGTAEGNANWPGVSAAVRLGRLSEGDIYSYVDAEILRTGAAPNATAVLDHFNKKFEGEFEAAGYTRQKVEAQPGGEKPKPTTVTTEWTAGTVPKAAEDEEKLSTHESAERTKKKFFGKNA